MCSPVTQRDRVQLEIAVLGGDEGRKTTFSPAGLPACQCRPSLSKFSPGRHNGHSSIVVCVLFISVYVQTQAALIFFFCHFDLTLILLRRVLSVSLICSSLSTVLISKKAQTLSCSRRVHTLTSSSSSSSSGSLQLLRSRVKLYAQKR